jgi:hypothetical protein
MEWVLADGAGDAEADEGGATGLRVARADAERGAA